MQNSRNRIIPKMNMNLSYFFCVRVLYDPGRHSKPIHVECFNFVIEMLHISHAMHILLKLVHKPETLSKNNHCRGCMEDL